MTRSSSLRPFARWLTAPALAAIVALAAACTKSESSSSGAPAPVESSTTSQGPAASAAPSATTSGASTAEAPAATATATAAAKAAADAGRAATEPAPAKADAGGSATGAASGSAGAAECGTKPLPDCPLQAWMKTNANPPVMKNDLPGLATALDKIVDLAPPGYTNWASIAKDGANAARSGDLNAAKASCRTCHDQYKQKYKTENRARKI